MRFGPFPKNDLTKIEAALNKAELRYELVVEDKNAFVDVPDEDLEKMELDKANPELESLGFSLGLPVPDFHNQDFVCPKCEHSQETPGPCPKDGTALLEFSDFVQHKNAAKAPSSVVFYIVMGIVLAAVAAYAIFG